MLRRLLLASAAFLAAACPIRAQYEASLNLGLSYSSTDLSSQGRDFSTLYRFFPEVELSRVFLDAWRVNLGLGYNRRGFVQRPLGEDERTVSLGSFSVPLSASYRFSFPLGWGGDGGAEPSDGGAPDAQGYSSTSSSPLSFFVGPLAGFQLNIFNSLSAPSHFNVDKEDINTNLAFVLGLEAGLDLGGRWQLKARYRHAFDLADVDSEARLGRLSGGFFTLGVVMAIDADEGRAVRAYPAQDSQICW